MSCICRVEGSIWTEGVGVAGGGGGGDQESQAWGDWGWGVMGWVGRETQRKKVFGKSIGNSLIVLRI